MMRSICPAVLIVIVTQVYSAPQFISFNDGKLGVNFGGYHAAVGLGGNGAKGGLYAEAGTPFGQSAKAGVDGSVNANGGIKGGLYAGATAGENINAAAGLAGNVNGGKPVGAGFASAQAGNSFSSSTLTGTISPPHQQIVQNNKQKPALQNTYQKTPFQLKEEDTNELTSNLDNSLKTETANNDKINSDIETKKPDDTQEQIKIIQYKPQQNGFQKSAVVGGTIGAKLNTGHVSPSIVDKRIDIGNENYNQYGISTQSDIKSVDQITYKKETSIGRNPTFFEDIFNIPIAALTAVRTFLTNTAGNTSISLQKSGSLQADTH